MQHQEHNKALLKVLLSGCYLSMTTSLSGRRLASKRAGGKLLISNLKNCDAFEEL